MNYYSIDQGAGRTVRLNGEDYLFFSGTSYLGMAINPTFQALLAEEQRRYGTVFGSSRNGNVRLAIYEKAEAELAAFVGADAALTLSSGMMAGQAVVNWLKDSGSRFIYGPNAHPAIWHDPRPALPAVSWEEWTTRLPEMILRLATNPLVIAVNSLDVVRAVDYSFEWVAKLPEDQEITLLIDDSHGLGVIGPGGSGIFSTIPRRSNIRLIVVASLAKAMGLPGGVVLADSVSLNALRQTPFFGACSPMPPAYLAVFDRATELYKLAYTQVLTNVRQVEILLSKWSFFQHIPGHPVFYTPVDELYEHLMANKILIYNFAYPSPLDKPNTRIVISALHQPDDLVQLAGVVREFAYLRRNLVYPNPL